MGLGRVAPAFGHPLPEGEGLEGTESHRPSATEGEGLWHALESGNPGVVEGAGVLGCYFWTPGFAGGVVQNISTVEVKAEQAKIVRGTV